MKLLALVLAACSAPAAPPVTPTPEPVRESVPPELACTADADCIWGELAIDVTRPEECACPHCMSAILSVTAARRRREIYEQHCKLVDGILDDRKLCPISHCRESKLGCRDGRCVDIERRYASSLRDRW